MLAKILLGISAAGALFLGLFPPGRYLARGAWEEVKILWHRKPIEQLVRDSTIDAATRAKLSLVLDARAFAEKELKLKAKKSFTTYTKLDSDTLTLVLTVAYRDTLAIHTWWWPVVGRVPYMGFFDFDAARREQRKWEDKGFDTELRPSAAFSTLGWFNDPLLSTTLSADSTFLVNTVIHELLHNTVWIPGDVNFNESFASFVGREGASLFFRARNDTAAMAQLRRDAPFEHAIGKFYEDLYHALDSAFKAHPGPGQRERRIAARDTVFANARVRLAKEIAPAFGIRDTTWADRVRLNIATVMARRVYRDDAAEFDALFAKMNNDLPATINRIAEVAKKAPKGSAFAAVAEAATEPIGVLLTPRMELVYTSGGADSPWTVDSVAHDVSLGDRAGCVRIDLRTSPAQTLADVRGYCADAEVMYTWDARTNQLRPSRLLRPNSAREFPVSGGRISRYETEAVNTETISGRTIVVIPTTVTTRDSTGRVLTRIRERFSVALATATGGVFEEPDASAPGGWRTTRTFELTAIRSR